MSLSIVGAERLARLSLYAELVAEVPGEFAEVGVYRGGSAFLLAMTDSGRPLHLFDTFSGMPEPGEHDQHKAGDFGDTSLAEVQKLMAAFPATQFHVGLFPGTAEGLEDARFALVHLDCDLYTSVRDGLNFFAPRMSAGGFIVLDDTNSPTCLGARRATDEWCVANNKHMLAPCECQVVIRF